jgi:hypothetical protein
MPKLTTYKAIKKASLHWLIKLNKVPIFYKWKEDKPDKLPFILVNYEKKEWIINYFTDTKVYYATIDDITGHCSTSVTNLINE